MNHSPHTRPLPPLYPLLRTLALACALLVALIKEVHVSEECLSNGEPDVGKINPLIYVTGAEKAYYGYGERLAAAFSVGQELKKDAS